MLPSSIVPASPLILVVTLKRLLRSTPWVIIGLKRISQYSFSSGVVSCRFILLPDSFCVSIQSPEVPSFRAVI